MKRILFATLFLFYSFVANSSDIWSGNSEIITLYPDQYNLVFYLDYSNNLQTSCERNRYKLDNSDSNKEYKTQVSLLIAAFMTNRKINVAFDSDQTSCSVTVNRFKIDK